MDEWMGGVPGGQTGPISRRPARGRPRIASSQVKELGPALTGLELLQLSPTVLEAGLHLVGLRAHLVGSLLQGPSLLLSLLAKVILPLAGARQGLLQLRGASARPEVAGAGARAGVALSEEAEGKGEASGEGGGLPHLLDLLLQALQFRVLLVDEGELREVAPLPWREAGEADPGGRRRWDPRDRERDGEDDHAETNTQRPREAETEGHRGRQSKSE